MKILFLLKKNLIYGSYSSVIAKSGLLNSARITASQLTKHLSVDTEIEVCVDGNEVDKFLHKHRPRICIIEAIWVTPTKMKELSGLYQNTNFFILVHSEVPFLALEGNAVSYIKQYNDIDGVYPAFNSEKTFEHFNSLGIYDLYLPNIYYDVEVTNAKYKIHCGVLHTGCFGAIRPFKNQLIQAMAAIAYANKNKLILHFHMNTSRIEQVGEGVFKNIISLFDGTQHKLIEHGWKEREAFLDIVSRMDLGLQVSLSESFNIVCADFVHKNVPIVVSPTIDWMPESQQVSTENLEKMIEMIEYSIVHRKRIVKKSVRYLNEYNKKSIAVWSKFITKFQ